MIKCTLGQAFTCIEMFSGDGNVARSMKYGMVACAALDIKHGEELMMVHQQNAFDLSTPAGLAPLSYYNLKCFKIVSNGHD